MNMDWEAVIDELRKQARYCEVNAEKGKGRTDLMLLGALIFFGLAQSLNEGSAPDREGREQ